jgi:hypothetical protein
MQIVQETLSQNKNKKGWQSDSSSRCGYLINLRYTTHTYCHQKKSPFLNTFSKLLVNNTEYVPENQNLLIVENNASLNTALRMEIVLAFWVFPVFVGHLRSCMSTSQRLHLSFQ